MMLRAICGTRDTENPMSVRGTSHTRYTSTRALVLLARDGVHAVCIATVTRLTHLELGQLVRPQFVSRQDQPDHVLR